MCGHLLTLVTAVLSWHLVTPLLLTSDPGTVEVNGGCFPGWERFNNSCYGFIDTLMGWGDGASWCKGFGGHLAVPNSPEELAFIKKFATDRRVIMWVGGTDVFGETNWLFVNSGNQIINFDWAEGEPNNIKNEDCLVVTGNKNKWNDLHCFRNHTSLCETEVLTSVDPGLLDPIVQAILPDVTAQLNLLGINLLNLI